MENILKDYSYYDELYDKFTINRCKQIIKNVREEEKTNSIWKRLKVTSNIDELLVSKEKVKSAFEKENTVKERIDSDKKTDKFIKSKKVPKVICDTCSKLMSLDNTIFKDWYWEEGDRVMFVFVCNECNKRKVIYDNWEERVTKKVFCPKCNIELDRNTIIEEGVYITTYKCIKCNYEKVDKIDLGVDNDKDELTFEEDRKEFCISLEEAESIDERWNNLYDEVELIFTWKDRKTLARLEEERKYKPLEKIKMMNFKELEIYLDKILNKNWYTDFTLSKPDVTEDIKVYFSVFNSTWEVSNMKSNKLLRKIIKDSMVWTNWLFIEQWRFENRLWVIKWRLKGIDNKDKLLELLKKKKI